MSSAEGDSYGFLSDDDGEDRTTRDMESSGTRNRDSSTRSTRKERPERLVGEGGGGGGGGGEVHHPSSGQRGRHQSVTIINRSDSDRDGDDDSNPSRRQQRKERERRAQRKMESEMDLALLSGDDDEPLKVEKKRPSRLKPPNPSAAEGLSTPLRASANDRHQQEDTVEARFGGRSKWFMGKVQRAYEVSPGKVLYDIAYDDGDNEDGVQAGRVRSPGQAPPPLRAGLAVELKLTRKGKGYHPGTIGRVNDNGSLYVKLEDGDSDWSASPQQVIPLYPYEPTKVPPSSGDTGLPESSKHDGSKRADGGARGDARKVTSPTGGKQVSKLSAAVGEGATFKSPLADPPVPEQEDSEIGREGFTGTTPSTPDTTASTSRGATSANASGREPSDLARQESQDSSSGLAAAAGAPPGGERHARWQCTNRVVAEDSPDDAEPRAGGTTAGIIEPVKKPVGGPTLKSLDELGMDRSVSAEGGQAGPGYPDIPPPSSLESTPTSVDATAAASIVSPSREDETSASTFVTPVAVGAMGTPIVSEAQKAGDDGTTPTAGDERIHGILTATSRAGREKTPRPAKTVEETVPRALDSHRENQPAPEKPEAAHGSANNASVQKLGPESSLAQESTNSSSVQPDERKTAISRKDDPVEPLHAEERATETVTGLGGVNHGTSLPPTPLPLQRTSRGSGGCTRWDTVRLSVQRRYAAEAMHLAEEVRLLKAKLTAADGYLQAKLAQQERRFREHIQDALQQERDKAQAVLGGHRAASARRISALSEELKLARRQLDAERNRRTKTGSAPNNARGKAASPPKLRPTDHRVPIRAKQRDDGNCYPTEDELPSSSANAVPGEGRADTTNNVDSLGYRDVVGTNAPTVPAGDARSVEHGGLAPGSKSADHLSAGLASMKQSVGELAARLEKLEGEGRGERALGAERRGFRMAPTDDGSRDPWSDQVYAQGRPAAINGGYRTPRGRRPVARGRPTESEENRRSVPPTSRRGPRGVRLGDRGRSADGGDVPPPLPFTSRPQHKASVNHEEELVEKGRGRGSHEECATADASVSEIEDATAVAAAATAAVLEPGDVGRVLLSTGSRRGRKPIPVAESGAGNVASNADVFCENRDSDGGVPCNNPDDRNTDVYPKNTDITNNTNYHQNPDKTHTAIYSKSPTNNADDIYCDDDKDGLRRKLETERRHSQKVLETMKSEVERVVGQFRARAERAEAAAASAERRATAKALQYLRSKPLSLPPSP